MLWVEAKGFVGKSPMTVEEEVAYPLSEKMMQISVVEVVEKGHVEGWVAVPNPRASNSAPGMNFLREVKGRKLLEREVEESKIHCESGGQVVQGLYSLGSRDFEEFCQEHFLRGAKEQKLLERGVEESRTHCELRGIEFENLDQEVEEWKIHCGLRDIELGG